MCRSSKVNIIRAFEDTFIARMKSNFNLTSHLVRQIKGAQSSRNSLFKVFHGYTVFVTILRPA
jgi:hypothetical protein